MIVNLKSIEVTDNGHARITFRTEKGNFSFIVPRVHASRVCRNLIDFTFDAGNYFMMLEKKIWKRTGEESLLFTKVYQSGKSETLQITRYEYEQEANNE